MVLYKSDVNAVDKQGNSALHTATANNYTAGMTLLLTSNASSAADPDIVNDAGDTPLLIATAADYLIGMQLLLENNADSNATNSKGISCLLVATELQSSASVQLLLSYSANPNSGNITTPLLLATTLRNAGRGFVSPEYIRKNRKFLPSKKNL